MKALFRRAFTLGVSTIASIVMMASILGVSTASWWIIGQPKVPKSLRR